MADTEDKLTPEGKAVHARAQKAKKAALATVRQRIDERMGQTGISMRKLALRAGVSARTVQRFLREPERDVHLGNVAAIAEVLLIDVRELLDPMPEERADEPVEGEGE